MIVLDPLNVGLDRFGTALNFDDPQHLFSIHVFEAVKCLLRDITALIGV